MRHEIASFIYTVNDYWKISKVYLIIFHIEFQFRETKNICESKKGVSLKNMYALL